MSPTVLREWSVVIPSPQMSLICGEGPSGATRGGPLAIDQLTNGSCDEFRLVKRNEMAALIGEHLAAVRRQGGQILLQLEPHFPEQIGRAHV